MTIKSLRRPTFLNICQTDRRPLGRSDQIRSDENTTLTAQQIEQDRYTLLVTDAFHQCKTIGECALNDPYLVARRESEQRSTSMNPRSSSRAFNSSTTTSSTEAGLPLQQMRSRRLTLTGWNAIFARPDRPLQRDSGETKDAPQYLLLSMATALQIARKIDGKSLSIEIGRCLSFGIDVRLTTYQRESCSANITWHPDLATDATPTDRVLLLSPLRRHRPLDQRQFLLWIDA